MYNYKLYDMLTERLNDEQISKFPISVRETALNNGLGEACMSLNMGYLIDLQEVATNIAATSNNEFDLTNTTNFPDGILKDYILLVVAKRLTQKAAKMLESTYQSGNSEYPRYYTFANKIFLFAGATVPAIDVYYLKKPSILKLSYTIDTGSTTTSIKVNDSDYSDDKDLSGKLLYFPEIGEYGVVDNNSVANTIALENTLNTAPSAGDTFTVVNSGAEPGADELSEPLLNAAFHEIVLSFAEMELWAMDGNAQKQNEAYQSATTKIEVLNSQYHKAEGVGTKRG